MFAAVPRLLPLLLLPTVLSPPAALAANILAFMPMPLKSHFGGFQPMFEELARRGHNVTVVSSFPLANRRVPNYTDVDVTPEKGLPEIDVMHLMDINFVMTVTTRWFFARLLSAQMEQATLIDFLRSEDNSFDLVMIESFLQEYTVALGHKYNAPVVNLSPAMVWVSASKWTHLPSTFSYIPDCCIGVTDDMSFVDRLKNTIAGLIQMFVEDYLYIPMIKAEMSKHFAYVGWQSRPTLEQMLNNVSLTLMNAYHAVGVCRPYLPGIVEVGGMHIKEPKPLPKDLQDYIDSASNGVIYFSFGSIMNLSNLPKEKLSSILNAISRLKQKVIIKWVPDKSIKLPQNVKVGSWLPQNDILAHPNVKLFITHGGLHSIEEAVYNEKPLIGIPFFADQLTNMRLVEKVGYGKLIPYNQITEESLGNAVEEVLSNPAFKDKATLQSRVYRDQPMKPLDRAIYWIEYVIRNDGAQYLKADSIGLNTAQYFLFDVTLFSLLPTAIIAWLGYRGIVKVSSKCKAG
ncbi:UDP-glucuronosyltransferase 2C1-like isoform X1 [Myzus persicae]|uniref:UDP-glucuronosyltransferase n=2 Tax=Myzus persicae TaxID=13164 RepID=A0A2D1GSJ3_MYZPE|nr:UDP-glucuronosyltransferase 2C1-like isoform X1 [Myzus persicae]ATN96045.1 UDP-glucuronosyl transferase 343B3 [Myzus persicae]